MTRSSNLLVAWIFIVTLASAVWATEPGPRHYAAWAFTLLVVAALKKWPFTLDAPPPSVRIGARDVALTTLIAAPAIVNLAGIWGRDVATCGDHPTYNGYALEAFAFWWPLRFLLAVAAIVVVLVALRRNPQSALPFAGVVVLALLALQGVPHGFTNRYPALLDFLTVPFRAALPVKSPYDIEQLVNTLSIPGWLLVLRPRFVGRRVDLAALATGALYYWQKDVVYHTSGNQLEPWAVVLLLTGGEHLLRYGRQGLWRVLLLLSTAVLVKETMTILALPCIVLLFFPRRERWKYLLTVAAAAAPALLYAAQPMANIWRGAGGYLSWHDAFGEHFALFKANTLHQFGIALPAFALGLAALLYLAFRSRAGLAFALGILSAAAIFFFSALQQLFAGEPRTSLVVLASAALALGLVAERLPRSLAVVTIVLVASLNAVPLAPFLRDAFDTPDTRNAFEYSTAPLFFPIREMLDHQTLVRPGQHVDVISNGKRLLSNFYPGLPEDLYPDLNARYRLTIGSYRDDLSRCRCRDDTARLAIFVRFRNVDEAHPMRAATEAEAADCRQQMEQSCSRRTTITHHGTIVGVLGVR